MRFISPTYIALAQPSRLIIYARELCERNNADLAPFPVEIWKMKIVPRKDLQ
jgi:hypothetical protein